MKADLGCVVNELLQESEVTNSDAFINFMGALYERLSIISCDIPFNNDGLIEVQNAVGEFIPVGWKSS